MKKTLNQIALAAARAALMEMDPGGEWKTGYGVKKKETMAEKRYWNYSTDGQPRDRANIPGRLEDLYTSESDAIRAAKAWCRSEGLEFDYDMVDEVTDRV